MLTHTVEVCYDPPQQVDIHKIVWDTVAEDRLKLACDEDSRADTAAVVIDTGTAYVCLVTGALCVTKAKIDTHIAKKHKYSATARDDSVTRFYQQVLDAILTHVDFAKIRLILLCSPAQVKEEFLSFAMDAAQAADPSSPAHNLITNKNKFMLVSVKSNTLGALQEALVDPNVANRMQSTKCQTDVLQWRKFQDMMNEDESRCCYGPQYVFAATAILRS